MQASPCMAQATPIQLRASATLSSPLICLSFPPCPFPGKSGHEASNLNACVLVCKALALPCGAVAIGYIPVRVTLDWLCVLFVTMRATVL